ncbi:hypothetical protein IJG20_02650 [Candidatus Saccharibacteria bacterium]|nr:hypothetical protein [Candidatus Saccharibacteria bacterium]
MKINNKEVPNDEIVREAVFDLVKEKGVPEEEREQEIERIEKEIDKKMTDEILSALPTESLEELKAVLAKDDFSPEEFEEVVNKSGIKLESVAQKVLREVRNEYLGAEEEPGEEE